ncbi:competence protein ComFB [Peptoclostridium litorale DSM 5388]|uniref:ComF operon family protein n=1 Tax=Peptoclostridium litorale DSM 5388 TaxID=1121324 RepID=A0A069RCV8_PEPLI|nr:competence protein ComFB [Peptoclostridium litorale]KDR94894.1 ComF operon family protein [Peptoclostridium litorale DSM 5388]SIN95060.1 competence protein ComFB [Peptoclostridium litorale DSM 5388]
MIKNYMEIVVDILLPKVLIHHPNICTCQNCMDDVKALALNHMQPLYVRTKRGEAFNKVKSLSKQFEADVLKELTTAVTIVSSNPKHDEE